MDGLWDIQLNGLYKKSIEVTNELSMNYITSGDCTKTELARYIYATMFSPCIKTLEKAISRGNLNS